MKKILCLSIMMIALMHNHVKAQDSTLFPKGEIVKNTDDYTGTIWLFLLNDIDLEAVVGGNTVTNPFMVTEVYIKENGKWKMAHLLSHI